MDAPAIVTGNGRGKVRILRRQDLDGRTKARKQFDAIAFGVAQDLGGAARLSTVQRHLVEAFAGIAIMVNAANARLLLGKDVDIVEHAQVVSTLTRVASRIGLGRVARDISDPLTYARQFESTNVEPAPEKPNGNNHSEKLTSTNVEPPTAISGVESAPVVAGSREGEP